MARRGGCHPGDGVSSYQVTTIEKEESIKEGKREESVGKKANRKGDEIVPRPKSILGNGLSTE